MARHPARISLYHLSLARLVGVFVAWAICVSSGATTYVTIEYAREAFAEYKAAVAATKEAFDLGDNDAYLENAEKATATLTRARIAFEDSDVLRQGDAVALVDYGLVLTIVGDDDLAVAAFDRAVVVDDKHAEAWRRLGQGLSKLGPKRTQDAEEALRRAIQLATEPNEKAEASAALGRLYFREGHYDLARARYQEALASDAKSIRARIGMGALLTRDGDVLLAAQTLDSIGSVPAEFQNELRKDLALSLKDFDRSRRWFPDEAAHHLAYGKLLVRAKLFAASLGPLKRAAKLDNDNTDILNFLGSIAQTVGDFTTAITAYELSLQINPDQPDSQEALDNLRTAAAAPPTR
jgi:tetratricopeptide (TPR) repeat protein